MRLLVYRSGQLIRTLQSDKPLDVGRQDPDRNDPRPVSLLETQDVGRLVVAEARATWIPRHWFTVQSDAESLVLKNIHTSLPLTITNEAPLAPGESRRFEYEFLADLGHGIAVRVETKRNSDPQLDFRTLASQPSVPGAWRATPIGRTIRRFAEEDAGDIASLLRLALQVVQQASGSDAFFQSAVEATVEIVDLDRAVIILDNPATNAASNDDARSQWKRVAAHRRIQPIVSFDDLPLSTTLIQRVCETKATVIHTPSDVQMGCSLVDVAFAVASPILDPERQVIGLLYGDRRVKPENDDRASSAIRDVEATLVEIIAGSIAGGLARQAEEQRRSTLSSFFSPSVAERLAKDPQLMEGKDAEISVLFCDIRRFSTVTEKLGPRKAIEWINDVMTELSDCVIESDGVLVDYVGDELMAMWGAPGNQPDHAPRAIRTALEMLATIDILRGRWASVINETFGAGIGISSGVARVGNVGSLRKFKYGALGNTVNLGSRLQSATKQLGVHCLASSATVVAADWEQHSRRVAKLEVVGIGEQVSVHEIVCSPSDPHWRQLRDRYEVALGHFESGHFHESARGVGELLPLYPEDLPSRKLLSRVLVELEDPTEQFNGVWKLASK